MTRPVFSNNDEYISLQIYKNKYESDDAVLVIYEEDEIWLPKSQMEDWPNVGEGGEILIKEWIAKQKGMI